MDSPNLRDPPLPRRTLALYAAPCLPLAGVGLPLVALLPTYYAQVLGLDLGSVGAAFMVVRLADIGLDPVLGVLMDRTRTRWGRFKPWLAAGAPLMMASIAWLFFAKPGVGAVYLAIGLGLAYGGWSICVLAQSAWGALLSPEFHERSRIYSWWQGANIIGLLMAVLTPVALGAVGFGGSATAMQSLGVMLMVLFPLTFAPALLGVAEPPAKGAQPQADAAAWRSLVALGAVWRGLTADLVLGLAFGMQASLFLFYFEAVKGAAAAAANLLLLAYFLAALAGGPLWAALAGRIDKHRALAASCLLYVVGLAGLWAIPPGHLAAALPAALFAGLPYSAPNLLLRSMMADAADEARLASGQDRSGILYALLNSTAKIGAALAVGATFLGLARAGFRASGGHNTPGALTGLSLLFLAAPAALNAMGAAVLMGYPLTRWRHAEIRAALDREGLG